MAVKDANQPETTPAAEKPAEKPVDQTQVTKQPTKGIDGFIAREKEGFLYPGDYGLVQGFRVFYANNRDKYKEDYEQCMYDFLGMKNPKKKEDEGK